MEFKKASLVAAADRLAAEVINAAMQGLKDAASSGPDGYPLEDVEVVLTALKLREGANGEIGARAAAAEACRRAVKAANPSRLEPIMAVEITVDDEFLGAVIGDLNQRRGTSRMSARAASSDCRGAMPLRNMSVTDPAGSLTEVARRSRCCSTRDTLQSA
jgi:elongation factor G